MLKDASSPIHLPDAGALGPEDCHVPAGWFDAGGRTEFGAMPVATRLRCDALVARRFSVTNRRRRRGSPAIRTEQAPWG